MPFVLHQNFKFVEGFNKIKTLNKNKYYNTIQKYNCLQIYFLHKLLIDYYNNIHFIYSHLYYIQFPVENHDLYCSRWDIVFRMILNICHL